MKSRAYERCATFIGLLFASSRCPNKPPAVPAPAAVIQGSLFFHVFWVLSSVTDFSPPPSIPPKKQQQVTQEDLTLLLFSLREGFPKHILIPH